MTDRPNLGFDLGASGLWRFPWLMDLFFGLVIGIPVTILGILSDWWQIGTGWRVALPVLVLCSVALPLYRQAVLSRVKLDLEPD